MINHPMKKMFIYCTVSTLLTGCMVGPDFHPMEGPNLCDYTEQPMPEKTVETYSSGGQAQYFD